MANDPDLLAFGACVRRWRLERELSQEELAERAGLHRDYVGGIERGERNVGVKAVFALARGLGCQARDLLPEGSGAVNASLRTADQG